MKTTDSVMRELKELLKCGDVNCQEGHYPLGMDEETGEVDWVGCPNCVVDGKYLPRVDVEKLKELYSHSLAKARRELVEETIDIINKMETWHYTNVSPLIFREDLKRLLTGDNPKEAK